jgi:prepilin signal peptidase PulO-like enzyme (type II secretory pathway)
MITLVYFIFGSFIGSFLHVIAYRGPKGTYFTKVRSACPHCQHELRWFELIPVLSYGLQLGKCSNCRQQISLAYPLSEMFCGLLVMGAYLRFGHSAHFVFALLFLSILFVLAVCDIYYYLLPNPGILLLSVVVVIWSIYGTSISLSDSLWTLLFSVFLIGLLIYLTQGGMGMGDFKLLAILGFFFGFYAYLQLLFLSSFLAIAFFGYLYIVRNKSPDYIYFGPFIAIAACLLLFFN